MTVQERLRAFRVDVGVTLRMQTSPKELREIADKLEDLQRNAHPGDSALAHRHEFDDKTAVEFYLDPRFYRPSRGEVRRWQKTNCIEQLTTLRG